MASNNRNNRNNRDDLLKAFVTRGKNRRQKGFKYQPAKQGALPPMEGAFRVQSNPRVKRGTYRPGKRSQGPARY